MKIASIAVAAAMLSTAPPAMAASAAWHGTAFVAAKSGTCTNYNPVGGIITVRLQPRNLLQNGTYSHMAWFGSDYAQAFELPNASFDALFRNVRYTSIWTSPGTPSFPVRVRFSSQTPAFSLGATNVSIVGQIQNYDWMQGCTVTFRMVLIRTDS